jgi:hypothetical protein
VTDTATPTAEHTVPPIDAEKIIELTETTRTYLFDHSAIEIIEPRQLVIRGSGAHRIIDSAGVLHYIAPGWRGFRVVDQKKAWTV